MWHTPLGDILKFVNISKTAKLLVGLALSGFCLFGSIAAAQNLQPYSLRSIWYIEDAPRPYWEIRVTCDDQATYRYMIRYNKQDPWCAKQAADLCSEEKVELAFELCADTYADRIAESERQQELLAQREQQRSALLQQEAELQRLRQALANRKAELQRRDQALREREQALAARRARLQ